MARKLGGRLVNMVICESKQVQNLDDDTSRLAFTWALTHVDRDGRVTGDPFLLKNRVFPRRRDIDEVKMYSCIKSWAREGLIIWYYAEDDHWIVYPNFRKHQPNLRYDREKPSIIPDHREGNIIYDIPEYEERLHHKALDATELDSDDSILDGVLRSYSGITPAEYKVKEGNSREENSKPRSERRPHRKVESCSQKFVAIDTQDQDPGSNLPSLPVEPNASLFFLVQQAFRSQNHQTAYDFGKEGFHIKQLLEKAEKEMPENPAEFLRGLMETLWRMRQIDPDFIGKHPFLPSTLNSKGIYPRVINSMNSTMAETEISKSITSIFKESFE
jgi:hypothetical protein